MRLLFSLVFIGLFSYTAHTQIKWDGEGHDDQWSTAANWFPDGVPGPADEVLLDNSFIGGNYTVELPNTPVTVKSLTIRPLPGVSQIYFVLPPTNTIESNAFVTTGNGSSYSIVIEPGGSFENQGTVSFGTNLSIADSIIIKDGANYFHRTQSDISGWIKRLSKAPDTEEGVFLFDVPAPDYTFSLDADGMIFGNLSFASFTLLSGVSYTINGPGDLEVKSNLNINVNTGLSLGISGNTAIRKDLLMFNGSTFDLQTSSANNTVKIGGGYLYIDGTITKSGSGHPQIQLNGSSSQSITLTGSIINDVELHINKPSGNLALLSPVTLPYKLTLTKGKIITSSANILTLADGAGSSGGSVLSFVDGPMRKAGNEDFIFPIGKGGMYTPIGMYNVSGESATDTFTAEYKRSNPQSTYGMAVNTTDLNHVSNVEYWNLTQGHGSAIKKISLAVHEASFCKELGRTYICRWDGAIWDKVNTSYVNDPDVGIYELGTLTTTTGLTGFTAPDSNVFTLGTDLNFILNPLPVNLVAFSAKKTGNTRSLIEWELAECCSAAVTFEIERGGDNRLFEKIGAIGGNETNVFIPLKIMTWQTV